MSKDALPEQTDTSLEVIAPDVELNRDKLNALIEFAERADKLGTALDNIRKFVLKRALPGDWVQHGDNLNLTGPGAERVLMSLGLTGQIKVSLTGWKYWKDTGTDKNGEWFVWWYEADAEIGGLRIEKVQGRAGSRDKFFGFEHGKWKDLADVKEADIRMAARRGVMKEVVKVALGLRSIPASSAAELGFDTSKIKKVEYGGGGGGGSKEPQKPAAKPDEPVKIKHVGQRKFKGKDDEEKTVFVVEDERGAKYETYSESIAKNAKMFQTAGTLVLIDSEPNKNPKFPGKLKGLKEAPQPADPEPVDQQPDAES